MRRVCPCSAKFSKNKLRKRNLRACKKLCRPTAMKTLLHRSEFQNSRKNHYFLPRWIYFHTVSLCAVKKIEKSLYLRTRSQSRAASIVRSFWIRKRARPLRSFRLSTYVCVRIEPKYVPRVRTHKHIYFYARALISTELSSACFAYIGTHDAGPRAIVTLICGARKEDYNTLAHFIRTHTCIVPTCRFFSLPRRSLLFFNRARERVAIN